METITAWPKQNHNSRTVSVTFCFASSVEIYTITSCHCHVCLTKQTKRITGMWPYSAWRPAALCSWDLTQSTTNLLPWRVILPTLVRKIQVPVHSPFFAVSTLNSARLIVVEDKTNLMQLHNLWPTVVQNKLWAGYKTHHNLMSILPPLRGWLKWLKPVPTVQLEQNV